MGRIQKGLRARREVFMNLAAKSAVIEGRASDLSDM